MTVGPGRPPQPAAALATRHASVWTVRLFGTFKVQDPDGGDATPVGRKARALLAYLVLADGEAVPRDRIAALLWSERGEDQARASLRQALHELRAMTLGDPAPLRVDRSAAAIAADALTSDCLRIAAADHGTLALLLGDRPDELLVDLDGVDPAFDEWLATERVRRNGERRRHVLAAAQQALVDHDADGAGRLATRLLAFEATDETAARTAMEASHQQGDRDAVRKTFLQLRDALREAFAAEPAEETTLLYRRLMTTGMPLRAMRQPAAFAANDEPRDGSHGDGLAVVADVATPSEEDQPPAQSQRKARPHPFVGPAVCSLVIAALAVAGFALRPFVAPVRPRTLLVMPLNAAPNDTAAQALHVGLSAKLARLIVGNDETLRVSEASQHTTASSPDTFRIDGESRSDGGFLHATIRVSHETGGPILWSQTFVHPVVEIDALREQIASKVGDVTACALGRYNPGANRFDAEALRLLLAACEQLHMMNVRETNKLFEKLLALQPDYAHGWGMLAAGKQLAALAQPADAATLEADAESAARRALELDPHEGEAYYARALRSSGIDRWSQRMDYLMRGHALDPANGQLDNGIGGALEQVGRMQEAGVFLEKAVLADPFGVYKAADSVQLLGFGGDPAGAMNVLNAARKRFGNHRAIAYADFDFSALVGDARHAQALLVDPARGFPLRPEQVALRSALIAARIAPSTDTTASADRALQAAIQSPDGNVALVIRTLARLGRVDDDYAFIARLPADVRDSLPTEVLFETMTRPLRADPRFMTLAAQQRLIPVWTATARWPDFCTDPSLPYDCHVEAQRAVSAQPRPLVAVR